MVKRQIASPLGGLYQWIDFYKPEFDSLQNMLFILLMSIIHSTGTKNILIKLLVVFLLPNTLEGFYLTLILNSHSLIEINVNDKSCLKSPLIWIIPSSQKKCGWALEHRCSWKGCFKWGYPKDSAKYLRDKILQKRLSGSRVYSTLLHHVVCNFSSSEHSARYWEMC